MSIYQSMINRVTDIIFTDTDKLQNYVLIGDNSSGKSEVLRKVIEKNLEKSIYFIDSVNRTFDVNQVQLLSKAYNSVKLDARSVVEKRIDSYNFNLQDTFAVAGAIEVLYAKYREKLEWLFKKFLGKELKIEREELGITVDNKILIDGEEVKLSSGYQAILRMFCELLYFSDVMQAQNENQGIVVIDEIDEYLSPKYSSQIMNFLQKEFPQMKYLVTTHSIDLVRCTENANIVILKNQTYEIYTNEQIMNFVSVQDIFTNLFFEDKMVHESDNDELDEKLRILLNLKIADLWDKNAQLELEGLENENLLPHQRMICRQIKEW